MMRKYLIEALLVLPLLAACESYSPSKQDIGIAAGAVLGGVLGRQIGHGSGQDVATIAGAALGAFFGSHVGRKMDREDQLKTSAALERSPDGRSNTWRNPNNGQTYSVRPTRTYDGPAGPCRDFTAVTDIDGREEVVEGSACRQSDGSWRAS